MKTAVTDCDSRRKHVNVKGELIEFDFPESPACDSSGS
jgi:hypothetical protein